jgi:hypothetical protein
MNHQQLKTIAANLPTTMDELATCELPENVVKTYGERLLRNVNAYIESNNLQSYLENRPKKKPCPVPAAAAAKAPDVINVLDDSGDEFGDDGIDYSAIPLPSSQPNASASNNTGASNFKSNTNSSKPTSSSYFK